jgi:M6 family metalloprotease-like protein
MAGLALALAGGLSATPALAQTETVVQGTLQLQWGDPPRALPGRSRLAPQLRVFLDQGPQQRHELDATQARRAAGDLYALANRRVAVSLSSPGRVMSSAQAVTAIVPADRLAPKASVVGTDGRVMAAAPVLGSTRWVTLMCKFSDIATEHKPRDYFHAQYGNAPGQLGHYWSQVSYGKVNLAGSAAHGWYSLPSPRAEYVKMVNGKNKAELSRLFADCAAAADAEVDFSGVQGVNLMFNGELDGYAWGGGACTTLDGTYICTRVTWNPPWSFNNLSPLAHEMGHGYGLPHSDNADGDGDTYDNPWDLLSDAWRYAATDATYGILPKHLSMYQRERLGWVDAARRLTVPAGNQQSLLLTLDAGSVEGSAHVQLVVLAMPAQPDPYRTVIYTLEARRRTGTYEARLAGDAVIIHKLENYGIAYSVDTDVPAADVSGNEGSMLKVGETWSTPDDVHWVQVVSATAEGFVVRVGPRPRSMSSPSQVLVKPSPVTASSRPPAVAAPATVTPRRQTLHSRCAGKPGLVRLLALCDVL